MLSILSRAVARPYHRSKYLSDWGRDVIAGLFLIVFFAVVIVVF